MSPSYSEIADSIIANSFDIHPLAFAYGSFDINQIAYLFFSELHDIGKSKKHLKEHPEAQRLLNIFPAEFIEQKVNEIAERDSYADFVQCRARYNQLINDQDIQNRLYIKRYTIHRMHCALMERDFGDSYNLLGSDCSGLTKEAEKFISSRPG